jgi:hypothetical protein
MDADIIEEKSYSKPRMSHWQQAIVCKTRARMAHICYPYAEQGRLVSIDTDGALVIPDEEDSNIPLKSENKNSAPFGTLLRVPLTNIHDIKARSYRADQKSKTPGVSRSVHDDGLNLLETPRKSKRKYVAKEQKPHTHNRNPRIKHPHSNSQERESYTTQHPLEVKPH